MSQCDWNCNADVTLQRVFPPLQPLSTFFLTLFILTWLALMQSNPVFVFLLCWTTSWFHLVEHDLFSALRTTCLFHSLQTRHHFMFLFLLFLFSLNVKEPLAVLATGLPWGDIKSAPLLFSLGFIVLVLPHKGVYTAQCFVGSGFHLPKSCNPQCWILSFNPLSPSVFCFLITPFPSLAPCLPRLPSLWYSLCLFPIVLLLFWCVSRSVIQWIGGGGVDASESHLSPWHRRAQSQREGWAFFYTQTCFSSFLFKCIHTCSYSETPWTAHHHNLICATALLGPWSEALFCGHAAPFTGTNDGIIIWIITDDIIEVIIRKNHNHNWGCVVGFFYIPCFGYKKLWLNLSLMIYRSE